jgi:hypothetical protein
MDDDNPAPFSPTVPTTLDDGSKLATLTPAQRELHGAFVRSTRELRANALRTITLLTAVSEGRLYLVLGFPSVAAYASHYSGFSPRLTRDFLDLGRKLRKLPKIAEAVESGRLPWTKAREICRQASPDDQDRMLDLAESCSRRDFQRLFAAEMEVRAPDPTTTPPPSQPHRPLPSLESPTKRPPRCPDRCHLVLSFDPEQHARWTALLAQHAGEPVPPSLEERLLAALARDGGGGRQCVSGPPPYLVVILQCPTCGVADIVTARGEATAAPALVAAAACDAMVQGLDGGRRATIGPRLRRLALQRARFGCEAQGCRNMHFLEVHHRRPLAAGGADTLENLVVLCSRCHRALHEGEARLRQELLAIGGAD